MQLKSEKLDYKYGTLVKFQIWKTIYNKKGLPNWRWVDCHGYLASSTSMNGRVWCVMGEDKYRVNADRILGLGDKSKVRTMTPPIGFTIEPIQFEQNVPGVAYYAGNISGIKMPVKPEDRQRLKIRPSIDELKLAIQKQKDMVNGNIAK
jgi:hypothetical protein|tara:strand:+ start:1977 stop:2423 length:447 start_codon:yes stop_codon:yes gene_type:complete